MNLQSSPNTPHTQYCATQPACYYPPPACSISGACQTTQANQPCAPGLPSQMQPVHGNVRRALGVAGLINRLPWTKKHTLDSLPGD